MKKVIKLVVLAIVVIFVIMVVKDISKNPIQKKDTTSDEILSDGTLWEAKTAL